MTQEKKEFTDLERLESDKSKYTSLKRSNSSNRKKLTRECTVVTSQKQSKW